MTGCKACGSNYNIEKHHYDYGKNMTIKLCRKCHRNVHSKKDLDFYGLYITALNEHLYEEIMTTEEEYYGEDYLVKIVRKRDINYPLYKIAYLKKSL